MKSNLFKSITLLALFSLVSLGFAPVTHAQPLYFIPTVQTAAATSTRVYMTPGTATTTLVFDSYLQGQIRGVNQGVLLTQLTASSTATTLKINEEVSQDGIDWYADNTMEGTTTNVYSLSPANSYFYQYSSTTPNGAVVPATANQGFKAVTLDFPTRFIRIFYTLALGGTNGAVWGQIIPERQSN